MTRVSQIGDSPLFPIRSVAVIGTGLMGGSIALAARDAGLDVVTYDVDPGTCEQLRESGFTVADTPGAACRDADVVVLAAHVDELLAIAPMIRPYLSPDTIVTDIASVKTPVRALVDTLSSELVSVIPSHPMAGSERSGFANASSSILSGCTWLVCCDTETVQTARLAHLFTTLGAGRILACPLARHDSLVAVVSHFPQMVSTLLAGAVLDAESEYAAGALAVAGPGFRDTTRLADSSSVMWHPILEANRTLVSTLLRRFADAVDATATELERNDLGAVDERFDRANLAREQWRAAQPAPAGETLAAAVHDPTADQAAAGHRWVDAITGHVAWFDRSLGWDTVRTSAESAREHRLVATGFLADIFGLDAGPLVERLRDSDEASDSARENYRWVTRALQDAGADVTEETTWTADGLFVGGVSVPGRGFVVIA